MPTPDHTLLTAKNSARRARKTAVDTRSRDSKLSKENKVFTCWVLRIYALILVPVGDLSCFAILP